MEKQYKSFEYHFRDQRLYDDYCSLYSIGYEYWEDPSYYFDCKNVHVKQCIFQYTVSGEGAIEINGKTYPMKAGQAFLIEKPGPYKYYIPKHSSHWELKFIALNLASIKYWRDITEKYGRMIHMNDNSEVLQYWNLIYQLSLQNKMNSFFMSSSYAYTFMMQLSEALKTEMDNTYSSDIIQNCIDVIHDNYDKELSLHYLAELCSMSESQLNKRFKETHKMAPIQYLVNHRIEVACALLLRTDDKIEAVASKVGFKDANYFTRTFKKIMNVTPREFREKECTQIVKESKENHVLVEKPPIHWL
jgi:AraC-like DNA-binding protein